jgi:hypothetical protein
VLPAITTIPTMAHVLIVLQTLNFRMVAAFKPSNATVGNSSLKDSALMFHGNALPSILMEPALLARQATISSQESVPFSKTLSLVERIASSHATLATSLTQLTVLAVLFIINSLELSTEPASLSSIDVYPHLFALFMEIKDNIVHFIDDLYN